MEKLSDQQGLVSELNKALSSSKRDSEKTGHPFEAVGPSIPAVHCGQCVYPFNGPESLKDEPPELYRTLAGYPRWGFVV